MSPSRLVSSPFVTGVYAPTRRVGEAILSGAALLMLLPLLLLCGLLLWLEDRADSPLLRQTRLGVGEETFEVLKLRTMRTERIRNGRKLSDAERLLFLGRLFRKLSIDELPQLVNVLRGEMSLIGPRPMPILYQPYFTDRERIRFEVRPGMSGLAQVSGRSFLSWDEKFALDVEYVENFGPRQDFRIFLQTLARLLIPQDVGTRGEDIPVESLHEIRAHMADERPRC